MTALRTCTSAAVVVFALAAAGPQAWAQDEHAAHAAPAPQAAATPQWQWTIDSNAFFGFNYQHRKFRDFNEWESQNWLMGTGRRTAARGTIVVSSMLSLEALTLRDIGSPQVFQTGETFRRAPLIDYQHPHDLFMGLGAEYTRPAGSRDAFRRAGCRGIAVAGADGVHASPVGDRQPAGAAVTPLHRLDAHHARRRARRYRRGRLAGRGIMVQGPRARREPARHRPWRARFDRGAAVVDSWALVSTGRPARGSRSPS